jgi:GTP-binding protein
MEAMKAELPEGVKTIFISSVSGFGIMELKDALWEEINKEENRVMTISHRAIEIRKVEKNEEENEEDEKELDPWAIEEEELSFDELDWEEEVEDKKGKRKY